MSWLFQGELFSKFADLTGKMKDTFSSALCNTLLSLATDTVDVRTRTYQRCHSNGQLATSTIIDHPQVYQAPLSPNAETQSAPTKRHKKLFHSCTLYHNHWEQKGAKNCWIPNQKHQPLTTMSDRLTMLASLTFQVLFVCLFNLLQWLSFKHASHHMKSQTGVKKTSFATTWFNLTISVVKLTTWFNWEILPLGQIGYECHR